MVYLQDAGMDMTAKINNYEGVKIQKDDVLSIVVYSKTSELVEPFNLATIVPVSIGGIHLIAKQPNTSGYTVDKNGEIDFPVFGKLRVEGLTREELSTFIKNKLIAENFVNDPIVMVRFLSFKIFVAGEVAKPGMYEITYDRITILEALAMAGDLTANGKRNNIKIIREKNGERKIYIVDLRTAELFNSPAYYLQQNDYIYVEPNNHKIKNANRK
jgi:polysaccharide export outer membrane protein